MAGYVDGFVIPVPKKNLETYLQSAEQAAQAAMKDPRIANFDPATLPFDAKRMFWGGFKYLVHH